MIKSLAITIPIAACLVSLGCATAAPDPMDGERGARLAEREPEASEPELDSLAAPNSTEPGRQRRLQEHMGLMKDGRPVRAMEWLPSSPELDPKEACDKGRTGPPIVFVHGSPGGFGAANALFAEPQLRCLRRLSVDRLGWGRSSSSTVEPSLVAQAAAVVAAISSAGEIEPAILVGHSLGGAVIARVAMDYPDRVSALVFLASSVDPALEKTTWYQAMSRWPLIRRMVPESLRKADAEIIGFKAELEALLPLWSDIKAPVLVIHGEGDSLVPVANVRFLEDVLNTEVLQVHRLRRRGHLIPWKESKLIATELSALLLRTGQSRMADLSVE